MFFSSASLRQTHGAHCHGQPDPHHPAPEREGEKKKSVVIFPPGADGVCVCCSGVGLY